MPLFLCCCYVALPQELERPSLEIDILNTERTQKAGKILRDLLDLCQLNDRPWKWHSMVRFRQECGLPAFGLDSNRTVHAF